jgi:hypothetical protein
MAGGVATILVAANPEPAGSGSVPHFFWAAVEFVALAVWPAFSRCRGLWCRTGCGLLSAAWLQR